jgi:formate dehydrogenase assembly factor FdhD
MVIAPITRKESLVIGFEILEGIVRFAREAKRLTRSQ